MKTLNAIKKEVAKDSGYAEWYILQKQLMTGAGNLEYYIDLIAKRYAEQALDEASDKVTLELDEKDPYRTNDHPEHQRECLGDGRDGNILAYINRDSILSIKEQLK